MRDHGYCLARPRPPRRLPDSHPSALRFRTSPRLPRPRPLRLRLASPGPPPPLPQSFSRRFAFVSVTAVALIGALVTYHLLDTLGHRDDLRDAIRKQPAGTDVMIHRVWGDCATLTVLTGDKRHDRSVIARRHGRTWRFQDSDQVVVDGDAIWSAARCRAAAKGAERARP